MPAKSFEGALFRAEFFFKLLAECEEEVVVPVVHRIRGEAAQFRRYGSNAC